MEDRYEVRPVGTVRRDESEADGACVIEVRPEFEPAMLGLAPGDRIQVLYWIHRLAEDRRLLLQAHPRGDRTRAMRGVFALRSPMRPNPIGSTEAVVRQVRGNALIVEGLDALDGSPVVDIKIVARP